MLISSPPPRLAFPRFSHVPFALRTRTPLLPVLSAFVPFLFELVRVRVRYFHISAKSCRSAGGPLIKCIRTSARGSWLRQKSCQCALAIVRAPYHLGSTVGDMIRKRGEHKAAACALGLRDACWRSCKRSVRRGLLSPEASFQTLLMEIVRA